MRTVWREARGDDRHPVQRRVTDSGPAQRDAADDEEESGDLGSGRQLTQHDHADHTDLTLDGSGSSALGTLLLLLLRMA